MSSENASPARMSATIGNDIVVERSFDVDGTPDEAWEKLRRLTAAHDPGPGAWWLPGFQCRATEVAAAAGRRLEVTKAEPPCQDTTIVFTFEHLGTGTRIHVTQSGFDPAFVEMAGEGFWAHGTFLLDEVERFFREDAAPG
jgi:hypothetical protein